MNRRDFVGGLAAVAAFAKPSRGQSRYQLQTFRGVNAGPVFHLLSDFEGRAPGRIALEAVFGSHLPETLVIQGALPDLTGQWFELRVYQSKDRPRLQAIDESGLFPRYGIKRLLFGLETDLTYLIPFESLNQRNQAWTALDGDQEWTRLRGADVSVAAITIYRNYRSR